MADKPRDSNFLQISRDLDDRKRIKGESLENVRPPLTDEELAEGRFEILPSTAIKEEAVKHKKKKKKKVEDDDEDNPSTTRVTSENYKQMYLERQSEEREKPEDQKAKDLGKELQKQQDETAKASIEKKLADEQRFRARELQNQIAWWQQQSGLGQYDEATINGTIETLQRELAGIPAVYW